MPLVSPDGTTLLLFSGGAVTSWRLDGGGLISTLLPRSDGGFVTEYSPDGATMLVNTTDAPPGRAAADAAFVYPNAAVEIVGAGTGEVHSRIEGAVLAHFTDDPRHVVALFADRTIGRYDLIEQRRLEPSVDVGFAVEDFVVSGDRLLVWGEYGLFEGLNGHRRRRLGCRRAPDRPSSGAGPHPCADKRTALHRGRRRRTAP